MDTSAKDCVALFDTSVEGKLACGWESGVLHQRTRTVKAGPMGLCEYCYPVWDTAHARAANTEAKKEAHAKAQKRLERETAGRQTQGRAADQRELRGARPDSDDGVSAEPAAGKRRERRRRIS